MLLQNYWGERVKLAHTLLQSIETRKGVSVKYKAFGFDEEKE
jgi:hypothetical protein